MFFTREIRLRRVTAFGMRGFISFHIPPCGIFHNDTVIISRRFSGISFLRRNSCGAPTGNLMRTVRSVLSEKVENSCISTIRIRLQYLISLVMLTIPRRHGILYLKIWALKLASLRSGDKSGKRNKKWVHYAREYARSCPDFA
jgi:hypothetical protein